LNLKKINAWEIDGGEPSDISGEVTNTDPDPSTPLPPPDQEPKKQSWTF